MYSGPHIIKDGLVLALDGASRRSTLKATQVSNILPDPGNWSTGTGGQTGYSPNGSSSEQNRVSVSDDPWGRSSITWRTTPDATSGADGGWNSSSYPIDNNSTYRYSMWVRRYTSGTGGNFYHGMNPAPIRNDNNSSQGNPYFSYLGISGLTYNQWYFVCAHVFPHNYTAGLRHPDSGWYEDGVKISDKSYGNCGTKDVRWKPTTTSAIHRSYHYYTTNVNSGIELAYPRVDKVDGNEPSIKELMEQGESGWKDLKSKTTYDLENNLQYSSDSVKSSFVFDGTDDYIDFGNDSRFDLRRQVTMELWFKLDALPSSWTNIFGKMNAAGDTSTRCYTVFINSSGYIHFTNYSSGVQYVLDTTNFISTGNWYHWVGTINRDTAEMKTYVNGTANNARSGIPTADMQVNTESLRIGYEGSTYSRLNGKVPVARLYNRVLSADEVEQNFKAYKNRFDI